MTTLESKYSLSGMDCPGCAVTIEKYCYKISGVKKVEVNYSSATLNIQYNSSETKIKIESGVQKLGFPLKEIRNIETRFQEHVSKQIVRNQFFKKNKIYISPRIYENKNQIQNKLTSKFTKTQISILIFAVLYAIFYCVQFFSIETSRALFDALALFCLYPVIKKVIQYFKVGFYFSVEFLMSTAVIGALFINASQEAAMVMILFYIGEALEGYTAKKASKGIESLSSLIPEFTYIVDKNNLIKKISVSQILKNQTLLIKPSERFPADGILIEGETVVDESLLTGESTPVHKKQNQKIYAGSLNTESPVKILTTQVGQDHCVSRLIKLVQDAQGSKSKTLRTIENFSKYYTPIILVIGILTAILPPLLGYALWQPSLYKGLAILLIGCPCALIISTPSAIAAGISAASKFGILIKHASALEIIGKVKTIAFDKTGTLTEGKLTVTDVISLTGEYSEHEILRIAHSVEQYSTHPLANSIGQFAKLKNIETYPVTESKTISGVGVSGKINNKVILISSPFYATENKFIPEDKLNTIEKMQHMNKTICTLNVDNKCVGFLALQDKIKDGVKLALDNLKNLNINTIILTGDHAINTTVVANLLNVKALSQLLPEHKLNTIREFAQNGKVAMVGDGINDAPALAAADVGIAMGEGTDIAVDSAQIIIANKNISSLVTAVKISRKAFNLITQNIIVALLLKLFFLYLVYKGVATLWMAILADTGATVVVTLNSMRLLKFKD